MSDKNYIVEKICDLNEARQYVNSYEYYLSNENIFRTNVFNKKSRTTVCFRGQEDCMVMYCENCDETHYNNMDVIVEIRKFDIRKKLYPIKVVCKECGSTYNIDDIRTIERHSKAEFSDSRLVFGKIFDDKDELVKFSFKTCNMLVEKGFYSVDNKYKLIFNTKTGQTYIHNHIQNKKNKLKFINLSLPLNNITYKGYLFDLAFKKCLVDEKNPDDYKINILKDIYKLLYAKISKNLGYNPKTIEDYAKEFNISMECEIYSISVLALYNRYPNLNPFILKKLNGYNSGITPLNRMRKIKNISKNPVEDFFRLYNIDLNETFLNYFNKGSKKIYEAIYYSSIFKNINYIKDIVSLDKDMDDEFDAYTINNLFKREYSSENSLTMLFRHIIKSEGEEKLYSILKYYFSKKRGYEFLRDISEYYFRVKNINSDLNIDLSIIINKLEKLARKDVYLEDLYYSRDYEGEMFCIRRFLVNELNLSVHQKYKNKFNFKIKTFDEYSEEYINFQHIKSNKKDKFNSRKYTFDESRYDWKNINISYLYSLAPTFNPYLLSILSQYETSNYGKSTRLEEVPLVLKNLNPLSTDILGDLFELYNIPKTKMLKKLIMNNPKMFSSLAIYSSLFKDINLLNNLVKNNCNIFARFDSLEDILSGKVTDNSEDFLSLCNLIKNMIEKQGELIVSRKIIDVCSEDFYSTLIDSARMYRNYKKLYNTEVLNFNGSFNEIHDRLIKLTGHSNRPLAKRDLKPYKYADEYKNLVSEYYGYYFDLAKNGKELVTVGIDLNNCVGSYIESVRKNKCIIIPVKHNNQYKICIELRLSYDTGVSKYELHQAKLNRNTPVYEDKEALEAVLLWMKEKDIIDKSRDIYKI